MLAYQCLVGRLLVGLVGILRCRNGKGSAPGGASPGAPRGGGLRARPGRGLRSSWSRLSAGGALDGPPRGGGLRALDGPFGRARGFV